MKKLIYIFLFGVFACDDPTENNLIVEPLYKPYNITYFRDERTGLCFAQSSPYPQSNNYSFTCVPCDSLKKALEFQEFFNKAK